jgi:RecA-family ATPase
MVIPDLTKTANKILSTAYPAPEHVVEGLVHTGLTILAAKAKIGKTLLATNIAIAAAQGERFLDTFNVSRSPVLYLSLEDTERRIQNRLLKMRYDAASGEEINFTPQWLTISEGGIEALYKWIEEHYTTRLIVIDTLAKFRGFKGKRGGFDGDYETIAGLKKLADEYSVAILVLHHLIKDTQRDIFDMVSGSTGLTAAADSIIIMQRNRNSQDAVLSVAGREIGDSSWGITLNDSTLTWEPKGYAEEVFLNRSRLEIVQYLKAQSEPVQLRDIAEALGKKKPVVHKLLNALTRDGIVIHHDGGFYQYREHTEVV